MYLYYKLMHNKLKYKLNIVHKILYYKIYFNGCIWWI